MGGFVDGVSGEKLVYSYITTVDWDGGDGNGWSFGFCFGFWYSGLGLWLGSAYNTATAARGVRYLDVDCFYLHIHLIEAAEVREKAGIYPPAPVGPHTAATSTIIPFTNPNRRL